MSSVSLVIFDCDGVLVDSELIACRTVSECLGESGIYLPIADVVSLYGGLTAKAMLKDLEWRFGSQLPVDLIETLQARCADAFDRELKPIAGVQEALIAISKQRCVASSSAPERIIHSLQLTGLLQYFGGNVFSATQVTHGKPAPDLFLLAAKTMSVLAHECVVIEDSVPGVQAAYAAGMRALGFTGGSHCQPGQSGKLVDGGAIRTFNRMTELPLILSDLC